MDRATDEMVLIQSVKKLNIDTAHEEGRQRRNLISEKARAGGMRGGVNRDTAAAKKMPGASPSSTASSISASPSLGGGTPSSTTPGSSRTSPGGGRHVSASMFDLWRKSGRSLQEARSMRTAARQEERRNARRDALNSKRDDLDLASPATGAGSAGKGTGGAATSTRSVACSLGDIKACLERSVVDIPRRTTTNSPSTPQSPQQSSTPRSTPATTPTSRASVSPVRPTPSGRAGGMDSGTSSGNNSSTGKTLDEPSSAYTDLRVEKRPDPELLPQVQQAQEKMVACRDNPEACMQHLKWLRMLTCRPGQPPIATMLAAKTPQYLIEVLTVSPLHAKEVAWALSNLAAGTPEQTSELLEAGAGRVMCELLEHDSDELAHTAVWGLANMAGDGPTVRDQVLECGVLSRIIALLEQLLPAKPDLEVVPLLAATMDAAVLPSTSAARQLADFLVASRPGNVDSRTFNGVLAEVSPALLDEMRRLARVSNNSNSNASVGGGGGNNMDTGTGTTTMDGQQQQQQQQERSSANIPSVVISRKTRERICTLVWCLLNLCRGKPRPEFAAVEPCIPVLLHALSSLGTNMHMSAATVDAAWALAYLSEDSNVLSDMIRHNTLPVVLSLLRETSPRQALFRPLLRLVGNFTVGQNDVTSVLMRGGVLELLLYFTNASQAWLARESLWALSNLAASDEDHVRVLVARRTHEFVTRLIGMGRLDERQKKEAWFLLSNLAEVGSEQDARAVRTTASTVGLNLGIG